MIDTLKDMPAVYLAGAGVLGLVVGSFLNVVIHRLPLMMERQWRRQCREFLDEAPADHAPEARLDLISPPSQCPHCGHPIGAAENIPVISYLLLRGRCRACGGPISARYPVVELGTALLSLIVVWQLGLTWAAGAALVLTWSLICLSVIDIDHQMLPDAITLPVLWLGLLISLPGLFVDSHTSIIGAACGYLALWLIYKAFKWLTGKEGMGYGDFKLLAMLGAWLGWKVLPLVILLSSVVGAATGIAMIVVRGRDRNIPIPFGPYLAAAGWLALLWGDGIIHGYFALMGIH